jgi:putative lipase involved disintegration of autophagic bodies
MITAISPKEEITSTNIMKQGQLVGDGLNLTDRATLLSLAEMAADAYVRLPDPAFVQIPGLSTLLPTGWDNVGVIGYVWSTPDLARMIVSFKRASGSLLTNSLSTNDEDVRQVKLSCYWSLIFRTTFSSPAAPVPSPLIQHRQTAP